MAEKTDPLLPDEGESLDPAEAAAVEEAVAGEAPPAIDLSSIPDSLPILPTEDSVLYPFTIVPLAFDEPYLIAAVDEAMRRERMVGVVMRRSAESAKKEQVAREDLNDVGTVAVIHRLVKHPEAGMRLLVQGVSRFRDPGRGQGLAFIKRFLDQWKGKISIRSGTARLTIVPPWDEDVPLSEHLPYFPGAQVQIIIPAQEAESR